jgi:hypothetical protein
MLNFKNGLIINGNPKINATLFGILITNDFGLYIEISNKVWQSFNL